MGRLRACHWVLRLPLCPRSSCRLYKIDTFLAAEAGQIRPEVLVMRRQVCTVKRARVWILRCVCVLLLTGCSDHVRRFVLMWYNCWLVAAEKFFSVTQSSCSLALPLASWIVGRCNGVVHPLRQKNICSSQSIQNRFANNILCFFHTSA